MFKHISLVALVLGLNAGLATALDVTNVVVEELTFELPATQRPKFLKLDHQIWTAVQSQQPGFLGKETLITKKDQKTVKLLVRWRNEESRAAVPKELRKKTAADFAKAMGGGENYKLLSVKTYMQHRVVLKNAKEKSTK